MSRFQRVRVWVLSLSEVITVLYDRSAAVVAFVMYNATTIHTTQSVVFLITPCTDTHVDPEVADVALQMH